MKAVVMAGGEGTRLRPLTTHRPKPLAPVLTKPSMEHIVLLLKKHGITEIVVTLHYLADEIEGYFGDGSEWGVHLFYSVEDSPLGTAGSVKQAEEFLKDDTFVIVSGDALTDIDLTQAIDFHRTNQAQATIILSHVPNPLEFGVVITDDNGRIRRFLEKPSWGEVFSDTVNTGMDVGCYCISACRFYFESEPREVFARGAIDPEFHVDTSMLKRAFADVGLYWIARPKAIRALSMSLERE